jgi:predicted O-methyltransferase YrrM
MPELASRIMRFARLYVGGFLGAGYVMSVGWRRPQTRDLLRQLGASLFGPTFDRVAPVLPQVACDAVNQGDVPIQLHFVAGTDGNVSLLELVLLSRAAAARKPQTLFEFGTFDGRSTVNLISNAGREAVIWTLDLPPQNTNGTRFSLDRQERKFADKPIVGARYLDTPYRLQIKQLLGDSATVDYAPFSGTVDFIFIDASHTYEYVRHDSLRAIEMVRPGSGIIFWHDYSVWDGVTRALNELYSSDPRFRGLKWIEGTTLAMLDLTA